MCDTFAAGASCTFGGISIFAKNSDREPDEAQIAISLAGLWITSPSQAAS